MTISNTILVTGASGFIGRHFVKRLAASHPRSTIIGFDLQEWTPAIENFTPVVGDLRTDDISRAVKEYRPQTIIHLAALCKEPGYPWREYFDVNSEGTRLLANAASTCDVRRIVYTSTMMVFAAGSARRSESDFCDPDTAYGTSKLAGELILRAWRAADETRSLRIVRPGVVFGPNDTGNVARLVRALARRRFVYAGRRDTVKSCIYVKDLASLLETLCSDAGQHTIYHGVYPSPTKLVDIVGAAREAAGITFRPPTVPVSLLQLASLPFFLLDPHGKRFGLHPRRVAKLATDTNVSADRLESLDWRAQFSLSDAFVDWLRDDPGLVTQDR